MSLQTVEIEAFSGPTSVLIGGGNQPSVVYINQGPAGPPAPDQPLPPSGVLVTGMLVDGEPIVLDCPLFSLNNDGRYSYGFHQYPAAGVYAFCDVEANYDVDDNNNIIPGSLHWTIEYYVSVAGTLTNYFEFRSNTVVATPDLVTAWTLVEKSANVTGTPVVTANKKFLPYTFEEWLGGKPVSSAWNNGTYPLFEEEKARVRANIGVDLASYVPFSGGVLDANATIEASTATTSSTFGGDVFGVQLSGNPSENSSLQYGGLQVQNAIGTMSVTPAGLTFPNSSTQTTAFPGFNNTALTGSPTAPTATFGDDDTSIATTAFVQAGLLGGTAVARNLEVEVRNQSGVTVPAGSIVYISGATGNKPLITLAQANNDTNSAQTIGFTKTAIANNGTGYVIVRGELENIDTSALAEGVQLYLSPTTAGTWTTTKPYAPQHLVYVGVVIRSHPTLGTILVAVQNGYELGEIHDVAIGTLADKDLLAYESSTDLWKNKTFSQLGLLTSEGAATTYAPKESPDLTGNVTITSNSASPALTITQDGTGDVVQFKDVTSDTTYSFIDQNGKVNTVPAVTTGAGFNIPNGVTPTSNLVNGDFWTTTSGVFTRINGNSVQIADSASGISYSGNNIFTSANLTFGNSTAASTTAIGNGATISGSNKSVNIGTNGVVGSTTAVNVGPAVGASTVSIGPTTASSTLNLATGATLTATTKAINIGTNGVSGSTTNITLGSATSGATNAVQINGPMTVGNNFTATGLNINIGTLTVTANYNFGTGALISGQTRTIGIGTNALAGSTNNITIGSTAGTSTTTLNGTTTIAGAATLSGATTVVGTASFTNADRPTSSATGSPAATSLMTRDDVDAAAFDNFGNIIPLQTPAFNSAPAGGTSQSSAPDRIASLGCGTVANGFARATFNRGVHLPTDNSGAAVNFSSPCSFAIRSVHVLQNTTCKTRIIIGGSGTTGASPATADNPALSDKGWGVEIAYNGSFMTIAAFAHNGTTFVIDPSPKSTGINQVSAYSQYTVITVSNNGSGTITAQAKQGRTVLATSTTTGGPTGTSATAGKAIDLVVTNGALNPANQVVYVTHAVLKLS